LGTDRRRQPIGVFDSGLGGLTVVKEMVDRLPHESILYFGDTARVPYGTKSPDTIRRFSREAAHFLLGRDVKMLVVACNTASAHALDVLAQETPVPVVGVIEAGARAAHHASETGRIGVIGTAGTIASGAYDRAVRALRPAVEVYAQACPMFVPLVEEGMAEHEAARLIADDYLAPLRELDIDTLVLGCTHYPAMRRLIGEVMGPAVRLIDSAEETALDVARLLREHDLLAPTDQQATREFMVSDLPLRFRRVGRLFVGDMIDVVEKVEVEGILPHVAP
jgi:glutamate racemase